MKINKNAFSLVEVIIAITIIFFLSLLTTMNFTNINQKKEKMLFKNVNVSLKHAIDSMLQNRNYYSEDLLFLDTSEADISSMHGTAMVRYDDVYKFRSLLLHELNIPVIGTSKCYMLENDKTPVSKDLCYKADNGVYWAIPDTDFRKNGVIKDKNTSGGISFYTPVTIYLKSTDLNSSDGFDKNAVVIGIRADGLFKIINTVDCNNKKYSSYVQCNVSDVFTL